MPASSGFIRGTLTRLSGALPSLPGAATFQCSSMRSQAIKAELEAGDQEQQDKARLALNRAITEGNGSWSAYVDSIMSVAAGKVLPMRGR